MKKMFAFLALSIGLMLLLVSLNSADEDRMQPIIPNLSPAPTFSVSTVPQNGDVNPYGVAFVPKGFTGGGPLRPGDILVSNFNDQNNTQGTGTTIVQVTPEGKAALFFSGNAGLGLTTALGVLKAGFVLVGNLPSPAGTCTPDTNGQELGVGMGSLIILNRRGQIVKTLADAHFLDGPWDLAVRDLGDYAQIFVSNALNGTVTRLDLRIPEFGDDVDVIGETRIASGYLHRCDPAALVVGPTGLAYDRRSDTLFVASTGDNAIFAIPHAGYTHQDEGMGKTVYRDDAHLRGPLALVLAPNGDLLTANGDAINPDPNQPSEIIEFTQQGMFVAEFSVDPSQGAAFGIALQSSEDQIHFAAVDDGTNMLDVWKIK